MSADHPDASTEPLMLPRVGKPVRVLVDRLESQIGSRVYVVHVVHEIDGPNPARAMMAGLGRTFLPQIAVRDEFASGSLHVRDVIDLPLFRHVALEHGDRLPADELGANSALRSDIVGLIIQWRLALLSL